VRTYGTKQDIDEDAYLAMVYEDETWETYDKDYVKTGKDAWSVAREVCDKFHQVITTDYVNHTQCFMRVILALRVLVNPV
jgi:hypothetical protein